jgi:hypothetical protein
MTSTPNNQPSLWGIVKVDGQAQIAAILLLIVWISAILVAIENSDTYSDGWGVSLLIGGIATAMCVPWFILRVRRVRNTFTAGVEVPGRVISYIYTGVRGTVYCIFEYVFNGQTLRSQVTLVKKAQTQWPVGHPLRIMVDPNKPSRVFIMDILG